MSSGFAARGKVAIAGYAHSDIVRHADRTLGAIALDTAKQAIADAGLRPEQIDGFTSSALLPTAGDHAVVDGVSTVTSGWLAQHLGVNPRYAVGFQGHGQTPGSVALAVNAIASGAADHVLVHRALYNPVRSYHGNPMARAAGSMQWIAPQGYFGPLAMIGLTYNEYLQRFGASPEAMAAVAVEARKNGSRIPWSYWHGRPLDEQATSTRRRSPSRSGASIATSPSTASPPSCSPRPSERRISRTGPSTWRATPAAARPATVCLLHWPLDDLYETGAETARRLWQAAGVGPADVDLPQLYDGFSPFVYVWLEVLGFCPVGEAHRFVQDGGIDSDSPSGLPVLSGGGALGNGRMHGIPQMLECYLQLAGRAGDRQRDGVSVALACHASPHLGGAVVYSGEQL